LQHCHVDPSFAIGGDLNDSGANAHHGTGGVFVAEADESDGSFLAFHPDVEVVTNVEADHLDDHGTVDAYVAVFDEFVGRPRPGTGCLRAWPPSAACAAGSSSRGWAAGSASTTTTRTTRPRSSRSSPRPAWWPARAGWWWCSSRTCTPGPGFSRSSSVAHWP